jgi:hypothetical protein
MEDIPFDTGVRVEIFDGRAIWELMYFGKARSQGLEILGAIGSTEARPTIRATA